MKIFKILTIILKLAVLIKANAEFSKMEECKSSNKSLKFYRCEINNGRFNVVFEFVKPIYKVHLIANFYRIVDSEFIQIFRAPDFEWCSIVGTKKRPNPVIKLFFDPIRKKFPGIFKCPITGLQNLTNIEPDYKMMMMLPVATYRITFKAHNNEDDDIATVAIILKIEA
ncbi:hypothetical protein PVAND_017638 [Polypedilum vanderplanki]|uniref:MD-2-related lipid-recognition domain-containing protein n=1 Tax=Polypedilum vanderplanki TaxID=319348 RepID=A0A9J6B8L9_POLVA|nr:hypothetical protein PVAND_017638 [Polypedilum vanderplanki]